MKKILLIIVPLVLSCTVKEKHREPDIQEIRYITRESLNVGSLIKRDLREKKAVVLCYPVHIKESYQLIKFLSSILNEYTFDGVYLDNAPNIVNKEQILSEIAKSSPKLAFEEFIDLYTYLDKNGIPLINTLKPTENKVLILAPENRFNTVRDLTLRNINKKDVIFMALAGIDSSKETFAAIEKIPYGKRVGTIPLKNSVYNNLSRDFYGLIVMGLPKKYSLVTPIKLYNQENYLSAPAEYLEENKSIIKSIQIERMNNYLIKEVERTRINLRIE